MTQPVEAICLKVVVTAGPAAAVAALQPILTQAAGGDEMVLVSLTLDFGLAHHPGETVFAEAWIDRATRALAFVQGRLSRPGGDLLVHASAVFRRATEA